jgi:hypothetical protein
MKALELYKHLTNALECCEENDVLSDHIMDIMDEVWWKHMTDQDHIQLKKDSNWELYPEDTATIAASGQEVKYGK